MTCCKLVYYISLFLQVSECWWSLHHLHLSWSTICWAVRQTIQRNIYWFLLKEVLLVYICRCQVKDTEKVLTTRAAGIRKQFQQLFWAPFMTSWSAEDVYSHAWVKPGYEKTHHLEHWTHTLWDPSDVLFCLLLFVLVEMSVRLSSEGLGAIVMLLLRRWKAIELTTA